jgi:hypothetical protein
MLIDDAHIGVTMLVMIWIVVYVLLPLLDRSK